MMRTWMELGARNLLKNRRRSCFTVLAVGMGYTAVALFGGFVLYVFTLLEEGFVYAYASGHLTVVAEDQRLHSAYQNVDRLLDAAQVDRIHDLCRADERVALATPMLMVGGFVSDGRISRPFFGKGKLPEDVAAMRQRARTHISRMAMFDGEPLSAEIPGGIGVSPRIAEELAGDAAGTALILLSTTEQGQINALDVHIRHVLHVPIGLGDLFLEMPLATARALHDTGGADRVAVLLERGVDVQQAREDLQQRLYAAGLPVRVYTWHELCPGYFDVRNMFTALFVFVFSIVFVIATLSVVNTVSMAVLERTREIGALRAQGLKRRGVLVMFAAESSLLALAGCVTGLLLAHGAVALIAATGIEWQPPVLTRKVPLEIYLTPALHTLSLAFLVLLAVLAALVPARRAARMKIVDALGHV